MWTVFTRVSVYTIITVRISDFLGRSGFETTVLNSNIAIYHRRKVSASLHCRIEIRDFVQLTLVPYTIFLRVEWVLTSICKKNNNWKWNFYYQRVNKLVTLFTFQTDCATGELSGRGYLFSDKLVSRVSLK